MAKVYIVMGVTRDYEDSETWIHSAHLNQDTAITAKQKMDIFIKALPNGGKRPDPDDSYDKKAAWLNGCKKALKKIDKKSRFYQFGVSYSIEAVPLAEFEDY